MTIRKLTEVFRPLNPEESLRAPRAIHYQGDDSLLRGVSRVSIIGAREASQAGLQRARKLSRRLASRGIVIVSGLAKGVDTAAHTAAIQAGGRTIGVIGTPLSVAYPAENRELQSHIAANHLLLSQFAEGSAVVKGNFPLRNRFIALISDATVIIEAKEGSGTIYQGWEALRLARPLWILGPTLEDGSLSWPKEFLRYGAQILSEDSTAELEEALPNRAVLQGPHVVQF